MLTATFLHAPGIGETTEKRLWQRGIRSWKRALSATPAELALSKAKIATFLPAVAASQEALTRNDHRYFASLLPAREHWRAMEAFGDRIGFLDIETNGGFRPDDITLIGVYDGFESRFYVQGKNLADFVAETERCALWVTYFGTGFDLPFLKRRFPEIPFDQLHVDLCPLLRRLGYTGGLKRVEESVGLRRPPEVDGMSGMDAVHLWNRYRRYRNTDALERLIQYNRADIENLKPLFDFAYPRLRERIGFDGESAAGSPLQPADGTTEL
ncbi:MAG: ribonuclease H-like domain-containing protein [Capsulimonadales bacterium]|nr:ribonuclease H-like domain-containing protein [Capsulimonadales bacterium]